MADKEKKELVLLNKYGLHVRPAGLFAKIASRFDAEVEVEKDGNVVSGKSIMGLTVALLGLINYYFFCCEAVYAVIYFIIRCTSRDFHADLRKFFSIALEAVCGTKLVVTASGPQAKQVLEELEALVQRKFDIPDEQ